MEDDQRQQKREDVPIGSGLKPKKKLSKTFLRDLRLMIQAHGYPTKANRAQRSQNKTGSSQQRENQNPRTSTKKQNFVPSFQNYNEFNKMVLESLDGCMIVLSTDGVILFVDENIVPLLGYLPREIMKRRLLTFLCDEEKNEVYQKIALKLPLSNSEGKHTDFCCFLQRGNVKLGNEYSYERVKFILTLRDIFDESCVFFGGFHAKPAYSWISPENFPLEDRYFLVGVISVIRAQMLKELCDANKSSEVIIIYDSDDESSSVDHKRVQNQGKSTETRALCGEYSAASLNTKNEPNNVQKSVPEDTTNVTEIYSASNMHISSPEIMQEPPARTASMTSVSFLFSMMGSESEVESNVIEQEGPRDLQPLMAFALFEDTKSQDGSLNIMNLKAPEDSMGPADQEAAGRDAQMLPTTSAYIVSLEPQSSEMTSKIRYSVKTKRSDLDLKKNKRFCDSTHSSKFSTEPEDTHPHPIQQCLEEHEQCLQEQEKYLKYQQLKSQEQMKDLKQQKQHHQMMQKTFQEQKQEQLQQPNQTQDIIPVQIVEPRKCSDFIQEEVSENQEYENHSLLEELPRVLVNLPPLAQSLSFEAGSLSYVPQSPVDAELDNIILDSIAVFMQMWQNVPSTHLIHINEGTWIDLQRDSGDELISQQQAEALDKSDEQPSEPGPFQVSLRHEQESRSSTQEDEFN